MEDDRAQVDLGVAVDLESSGEPVAVPRQPKRRFVGRRTADAQAQSPENGSTQGSTDERAVAQGRLSQLLQCQNGL